MASEWPSGTRNLATSFGGLTRSALMSLVKSKGNKTTELRMLKLLRKESLSGWRRHVDLFGKPDFIWRKNKLALFIDGCFWHGHSCDRNLTPKENSKEWLAKIVRNRLRDRKVTRGLTYQGWDVIRIWECELARYPDRCISKLKKRFRSPEKRDTSH